MATNQDVKTKLDAQYRTLLILWMAFLSMFVVYYFLLVAIGWHATQENRQLTIFFNVLSPLLVAVSFVVKRKFLSRSVETQDPRLVNTGFIVAAAFCEAGALVGLLDALAAQDRYYFLLIGFAMLGLVLHFPRRAQLEAASYKNPNSLN
jgi:hypothetical protein